MGEITDAAYYADREKIERNLAAIETNAMVAGIHREMADRYREKSGRPKSEQSPLLTLIATPS